ncbi:hypothetical protein QJQ45_028171 [Haematococcus lacustris]|nr:hypothetical protein QJQ45_028171 [Haematococcus lacustris]
MAATSLSSSCPAVQLPLLLQHRQSGMICLLGSWHGMLSQTGSNCLLSRNLATSASQQPLPTVYHLGLYNLRDNPGARKQRIRVGRGDSARRGNYCGRGIKGKKARGRAHILYDGGQLGLLKFPISRERAPYEALYNQLSLYRVIEYVQLGLLDHRRVITMKDLQDTGCVSKEIKYGVMLYGSAKGQLAVPLHLQASVWVVTLEVSVDMVALVSVTACTPDARSTVQAAGGSVTRVYYEEQGLKGLLHPELYTVKRLPLPLPAHSWHPRHQDKFDAIGQTDPAKIPAMTSNSSKAGCKMLRPQPVATIPASCVAGSAACWVDGTDHREARSADIVAVLARTQRF